MKHTFNKSEFIQFGQFKFDARTRIEDHLTGEEDWNVSRGGKHGLFHFDESDATIKRLFDSSCEALEMLLWNEFSKDHSKIKDFDGDLNTREYNYILKDGIGKG